MNHQNIEVLCLQKYPEFFDDTIALLNQQWPRSRTARLRSLEQGSKDGLPTSLVLVHQRVNGKRNVIAHSKISAIPYKPGLCFVESVVVASELRGKGLGRLIMQETEKYVKSMGATTLYLTTYDQQDFYSKLGYEFTDPIVVFGGSLKFAEKTDNFGSINFPNPKNDLQLQYNVNTDKEATLRNVPTSRPPPPPPPPPMCNNNVNVNNVASPKLTMRKHLTSNNNAK